MNDSPKIIAQDEKFRIVRTANGSYVVEMEDGCDGLGVERWKHCELGERGMKTITQLLRDYIIREAVKKEKAHESEQSEPREHSESGHSVV